MTLILTIENEQSLPNGAPVSVKLTDQGGLDIGRGANVDWTLPDPTRFISGKHCEIKYRGDGYWLNDLSTNGTFVNDSARRVQAPYKLHHGDRLTIGSYVIAVAIEADEAQPLLAEPELALMHEPTPAAGECANAEIFMAAVIAAPEAETAEPGARAAPPRDDHGRGERTDDQGPDNGAAAALGFLAREFTGPSQLEAVDPAPLATNPEIMAASPRFTPAGAPASDRAALPVKAQAVETQDWGWPEQSGQAPANPSSYQRESQHQREPNHATNGEAASPETAPGPEEFLRHFACGAGIPERIFAHQDGLEVAEQLGGLMRMVVEDLTQLLSARFKAKRFTRTSSQTMIQALDNNPLKFAPTTDDALKIMFGPRTSGYLDAKRAFEGAFADLKTHQINTFAAMQQAVRMLVEDLDPKAIDEAAGSDKGFAALFGSRKSRLWDLYLARWQAKALRHEDGLVEAFMLYFAQCYDQAKDSN